MMRRVFLGLTILVLAKHHRSSSVRAFQPSGGGKQPSQKVIKERQTRLPVAVPLPLQDVETTTSASTSSRSTAGSTDGSATNKSQSKKKYRLEKTQRKAVNNNHNSDNDNTNKHNNNHNTKHNNKHNNNPRKDDDEKKQFRWLYWLYKQWNDSPVSLVDKSILQQFLPAAQCWKSKRTTVGARRATELVERYTIEYLAGNPHTQAHVSASKGCYFAKLLRTGWEAWLQLEDDSDNNTDNSDTANKLLDNIMIRVDRAIQESHTNNKNAAMMDETVARAKTLQRLVQEHRVMIQEKIVLESSSSRHMPEIVNLLHQTMAFTQHHATTSRHLEDSLVAMQQMVVSLQQIVRTCRTTTTSSGDNASAMEVVDNLERELVFTRSEQERLLQSASWLSVAMPFWEFLHHSIIRALVHANEHDRAQQSLEQMQDMLEQYYQYHTDGGRPADVENKNDNKIKPGTLERIVALEEREGKELSRLIQNDRAFQWLHWLSHQLSISSVGEASESVLKLVMPAISMHAKRKTKQDAEQAEELLNRYVNEFQAGNPYATETLSNSFFNSVCDAWAKLGNPQRAQRVLNDMIQLQSEFEDSLPHLKPDVISLSTLAAAWANSREPKAAQQAEEILLRMEEEGLNPTTITYNTVLRALIHSPGDVGKAMRAEEIVRRLEDRYEAGHDECQPSIRTYQSLISAWSRTDLSGTAQKAEQVLNFLDTKSQEEGHSHLEPNAHCFGAAIHAWAYSQEEQKAHRAYNILSHMRDLYENQGKEHCKPNVVVYTAVVNACASPVLEEEKEEAYQIAQLAMDELCGNRRRYGWPNFCTYAAFLKVCETTLEQPERDNVVRSVFSDCCEAGQVAEVVIEKFKRAASENLYSELLIDTGIEVPNNTGRYNLPRSWTKRVQGAQSRTKRPDKKKRSRPERARLKEVRVLSGSVGRYSKGKDGDAISFEQRSF